MANSSSPQNLDRLIVHQFDIHEPSPGGIDTCIRGLLRHKPEPEIIGVVGVSVKADQKDKIGKWQKVDFEGRKVFFLPVVVLDPANQRRTMPHSLKVFLGLRRYNHLIPKPKILQTHRADLALFSRPLFSGSKLLYSIHTQGGGISSKNSDSFWRFLSKIHVKMEEYIIKKATWILVFNPTYGAELQRRRAQVLSCPTWFEPSSDKAQTRTSRTVFWAGRLEQPKNPLLAIESMVKLSLLDSANNWTLKIAGVGTLADEIARAKSECDSVSNLEIQILGRVSPTEMVNYINSSSLFLMTSLPGYEGFPRVLVEAMAGGLPSVVTLGCDTGNLIVAGENGEVVDPEPVKIAHALLEAESYSRVRVKETVKHLSAPAVVSQIYSFTRQ